MTVQIETVRAGVTNIYLLRERGTVLVDPGGPTRGTAGVRKVLSRLGTPPRLDLMVITHGHFDHVAAAVGLREATRAKVAVHRADAAWLKVGEVVWPRGVTRWGKIVRSVLGPIMIPFLRVTAFEPDIQLDDDGLDLEPYGVTGRVVYTPGHTPGSVSVILPSGEAFVGDLAMNGPPFCLKPSFGIFAHQPEMVPAAWTRLLSLGARTVYPAHGRPFPASALAV